MLVPSLIERVVNGEVVTVEGDPGLRINPIYVDDAVRVFEPALAPVRLRRLQRRGRRGRDADASWSS